MRFLHTIIGLLVAGGLGVGAFFSVLHLIQNPSVSQLQEMGIYGVVGGAIGWIATEIFASARHGLLHKVAGFIFVVGVLITGAFALLDPTNSVVMNRSSSSQPSSGAPSNQTGPVLSSSPILAIPPLGSTTPTVPATTAPAVGAASQPFWGMLLAKMKVLALAVVLILVVLLMLPIGRRFVAYRLERHGRFGLYVANFIAGNRLQQNLVTGFSGTHGTDRLMSKREMTEHFGGGHGGIVLGRLGSKMLTYHRDGGVLVEARAGAGKGVSFVIPTILHNPDRTVIVLDPKGENLAVTGRSRRDAGRRVIVVDPANITDSPASGLNLLTETIPKAGELVSAKVAILVGLLMPPKDGPGSANDFFRDAARELLRGLLAWFATCPDALLPANQPRTLEGIRRLLVAGPDAVKSYIGDTIMKNLGADLSVHSILVGLGQFLDLPRETFGSVPSNAAQSLNFLTTMGWQRALCSPKADWRLADLRDPNTDLFLVVPQTWLRSTPEATRLLIGTIMDSLMEAGTLAVKPLVILDEVAQLGKCQPIVQSLEIGRTVCSPLLIIQSRAQLEQEYGKATAQVIADTVAVQAFLGATDPATAKRISDLTGSQTLQVRSASHGKNARSTTSEIGRPVLTPGEVLRLDPGAAILVVPGIPAAKVVRVKYFDWPTFRGKFDPFVERPPLVVPPPRDTI